MPKRIFFTAAAEAKLRPGRRTKSGAKFAAGQTPAEDTIATLEGYPIVWNAVSSDRGGYQVRLLPNSAKFAAPTFALWHHDPAKVLGNTANSTLRITPDDYGVFVSFDVPDTCDGRDANTLVSQKYVEGMSFAMVDAPEGTTTTENGVTIFNASNYLVDEVSVTGIPAFDETEIAPAENKAGEGEIEQDDDFAARRTDALRFEKLRFDFLALDGAELPA